MKTRRYAIALAVGALTSMSALSSAVFRFQFDENGNGRYEMPGTGWITNNGFVGIDPSGGLPNTNVLMYKLPEAVGAGDIAFYENGKSPTVDYLSDVFRFWNSAVAAESYLIFYSDIGDPDLADTGFPHDLSPYIWIEESGVEGGTQWCVWDLGYPNNNRYEGLSDVGVPGPAAALPMLVGLAAIAKRRRKV